MPRRIPLLLAAAPICSATLLSAAAVAQPTTKNAKPAAPPSQPAPTTTAPPKDPLKGPSVATPAAAPTLVHRDFAGKVIRLDVQPAEAAVKLLTLDDATRAKVDEVLLQRAGMLDKIVTANLELLVKLHNAHESGDKAESARLFRGLIDTTAPLRDRGPLIHELSGTLSAQQNAEVKRLVQEYMKAIADEDLATPASPVHDGDRAPTTPATTPAPAGERAAAARDEVLRLTGVEIKRAYERTIGAQARDFDVLLKDLSVTPEQESKIRKLVGDTFTANAGKVTPQDRARLFGQVYSLLTPDQQKQLLSRISPAHGGQPGAAPKPAAK